MTAPGQSPVGTTRGNGIGMLTSPVSKALSAFLSFEEGNEFSNLEQSKPVFADVIKQESC